MASQSNYIFRNVNEVGKSSNFIFSQKNDQAKNIFLLQIPKPRPYLKVSPKRWPSKVLFFLPSYAAVRIRTQAHGVALSSGDLYSGCSTDWATATTATNKNKNIYLTYLTIGEIGRFYFTTVAAIDQVLFISSCYASSRLWRWKENTQETQQKIKMFDWRMTRGWFGNFLLWRLAAKQQ